MNDRGPNEAGRIADLERELDRRGARIDELESQLASTRTVAEAARELAEALNQPGSVDERLSNSTDEIERVRETLPEVDRTRQQLTVDRKELAKHVESPEDRIETLESENAVLRGQLREVIERLDGSIGDETEEIIQGDGDPVEFGYTSIDDESPSYVVANEEHSLEDPTSIPEIGAEIAEACADSQCTEAVAGEVLLALVRDGPLETRLLADRVDRSQVAVQGLLSELRIRGVLDRVEERTYDVAEVLRKRVVDPEPDDPA